MRVFLRTWTSSRGIGFSLILPLALLQKELTRPNPVIHVPFPLGSQWHNINGITSYVSCTTPYQINSWFLYSRHHFSQKDFYGVTSSAPLGAPDSQSWLCSFSDIVNLSSWHPLRSTEATTKWPCSKSGERFFHSYVIIESLKGSPQVQNHYMQECCCWKNKPSVMFFSFLWFWWNKNVSLSFFLQYSFLLSKSPPHRPPQGGAAAP